MRTAQTACHTGSQPGAGARVLLVEDDPEQCEMMSARLRSDGYSVFEQHQGDVVLAQMTSLTEDSWPYEGVDLLVLDLWLPGSGGLDVLFELRHAGWTLPVVLMTGNASSAVVEEAAHYGVPLLRKPFTLDKLSETALATLLHRPIDPDGHG